MKKRQPLGPQCGGIRILASAVAAALGGSPAYAQDAPAGAQGPLEEVVVTGSRIVRRDLEANSPIMTLDAQRFEESSTIAIESVVNQMPQFVPEGTQFDQGVQAGPTASLGIGSVNLRGIGSNRTLVLVDGRPMASCDLPLSAVSNKRVTTIEGLGGRHPVQKALAAEQAAQCGYCMSGIVMSAVALLSTNKKPKEEEVRAALDKNLCRCGSHNRVVRAVLRAAHE